MDAWIDWNLTLDLNLVGIFINVLFVVLFRRFGKNVLKEKLKWNIKKQLDLATIFQIHIPTGDKERKWQKNRKVWNTFALVLISLAKKLSFEYMLSLTITMMICFISLSKESDISQSVYIILSHFPQNEEKKTNWDGWGSRLLNLPPKTLLRSTFWWILGPVLRLLSGDGFMESKTLGWIWMYTDTGGTRPDPWIFKLQTHHFFWSHFFLKHWSQSVFLSIGSSQKQITRFFFFFLETFAASLLWILIVSLFGGCQAFSSATPFFLPYFLFIHESNRAGSVVPFFFGEDWWQPRISSAWRA